MLQGKTYNEKKLKPEHIALFLPSLVGGGAERVFLNLASGFAERGIKVDLVVACAFGDLDKQVDVRVRVIDLKKPRALTSIPGLVRYLQAEQPPLMISGLKQANLAAILARIFARTKGKLIITEHNSLRSQVQISLKERLVLQFAKLLYSHADRLIAVSEGVAEDFERFVRNDKAKIVVIYNPILMDKIISVSLLQPDHPWLIGKEIPVLLAAGRLHLNKDYPTLLRAVKRIVQRRPIRLIILGQGDEREYLEELIGELNLQDIVSMPGFVCNPYAYMSKCDVFVLSSRVEGFAMVVLEALACGISVVSTDCSSGPAEILEGGKFGKLVPVGDNIQMADAIIQQLNQPFPVEAAQKRAREFDIKNIVQQYIDLIEAVLD